MSSVVTTTSTILSPASHIEAFGAGGANGAALYKRPLSSSSAPSLPAKRLALPTSELQQLKSSSGIPATTARPDQRVNVRVPVARACYSRLLPGQVAFVNRHFGRGHVGAATGPGGLTHVASLEELNDMLAIEDNHVVLGAGSSANDLFRKMDARDLHRTSVNKAGKRVRTRLSFNGFDALAVVPSAQHPLHQFALDGLVATRVEEVDDDQQRDTYSSASAQQACIVAVQGHAPMRLAHVPGEVGTGVMDAHQRGQTPPSHAFLQPVRILAKVYVVLVAVLVDDAEQRYRLQYETVSSSNLDVDPRYTSGLHTLFRTTMRTPNGSRGPILKGDRIVLRATELGSVVDTHFGPRDQPQLVVCVRVVPYEPTRVAMMEVASKEAPNKSNSTNSCPVSVPKDVYVTFVKPSNPRLAKANAVKGCVESKKQRQQNAGSSISNSKGVPTGISSAEFDKLQKSISDMRALLVSMAGEVNESKQREEEALDEVRQLRTRVEELAKEDIEREQDAVAKQQADEVAREAARKAQRDVDRANQRASDEQRSERTIEEIRILKTHVDELSDAAEARQRAREEAREEAREQAREEAREEARDEEAAERTTRDEKMMEAIRKLRSKVNDVAKSSEEMAKKRADKLEQRIVELLKANERREQKMNQKEQTREKTLQDLDKKIDDFLEAQGRRATDAVELLVKNRILEWVEAILNREEGKMQDLKTEEDKKLKQFAQELIERLELADEVEQPPYEDFDEELVDRPRVSGYI